MPYVQGQKTINVPNGAKKGQSVKKVYLKPKVGRMSYAGNSNSVSPMTRQSRSQSHANLPQPHLAATGGQ